MTDSNFKVGDIVDYHSIIGGPVTSTEHTIQHIGELGHGEKVAWLSDKSGCVSLKALSFSHGYNPRIEGTSDN